ncbi:MAG TPA: hypothetical protein VER03_11310 [Bryobacteraceae bacterium]|nr:hypothetical protein [Bryobacteraceae bacterium]
MKLCTFLFALFPLAAAPTYTVVNIGGVGGNLSEAFGINSAGVVAGRAIDAQGSSQGFAYESFAQSFGSDSDARGINSAGEVIGTRGGYATVWRGGSPETVPTLGGNSSYGLGISDAGHVTGASVRSDGELHAFLAFNGHLVDVGTLGGTWSAGYSVNNSGQVVGVAETAGGNMSGFRWDESSGKMQQLTGPGGSIDTRAFAINSSGMVAGAALNANGQYQAALWDSEGSVLDLGSFGNSGSFAYGLNDSGSVVGYTFDSLGRQRAFVWTEGMLFDLNSMVEAPGWSFTAAYGINSQGQIVGTGYYNGVSAAFRLDPVLEAPPSADELVSSVPEPGYAVPILAGLIAVLYKRKP